MLGRPDVTSAGQLVTRLGSVNVVAFFFTLITVSHQKGSRPLLCDDSEDKEDEEPEADTEPEIKVCFLCRLHVAFLFNNLFI